MCLCLWFSVAFDLGLFVGGLFILAFSIKNNSISGTDMLCIGQLLFVEMQSEVDICIEKAFPKWIRHSRRRGSRSRDWSLSSHNKPKPEAGTEPEL